MNGTFVAMSLIRRPLLIIRANRRAYLLVNVFVYGALVLGMGLGMLFPELHAARTESFIEGNDGALVDAVIRTPWLFAMTIFLVNVFPTALLLIVAPSLVVPFAGLVVFAVKTVDIGIKLAPVDQTMALMLIPHSVTILIEFQAYALVLFGAYLLGQSWLRPSTVGASTRRQGYLTGLRRLGWIWVPALALFLVGAIYEALEIYFLVPLILRP